MTNKVESKNTVIASQRRSNPNLESTILANEKIEQSNPTQIQSESNKIQESFIAFLDSDDCLTSNALARVNQHCNKSDIYMSGFAFFGDKITKTTPCPMDSVIKMQDFIKHQIDIATPWLYILNAKLAFKNALFFPRIMGGSDVVFCTQSCFIANSIFIDSVPIYIYNQSHNSIIRTKLNKARRAFWARNYLQIIHALLDMKNKNKNNIWDEFFHRAIKTNLKNCIFNLALCGNKAEFSRFELLKFRKFLKKKEIIYIIFPKILILFKPRLRKKNTPYL